MKRTAATKKALAKKSVKRTISRSSSRPALNQNVFFRRVVIISVCLVLCVGLFAMFNKNSVDKSVAGASIMRGVFEQATITLPTIANATSYNIYYKQSGDKSYTNAVRNIPANTHTYTISYLKKGVTYQYVISALQNKKEIYFSPISTLTNLQSM